MEFPHHMVDVVEECKISPPLGSVPCTTLPITCFDLNLLTLPPVQRLFFYEFHHSKTHFMATIFPNIKHSLSITLQHFYPLAGNMIWTQESTIPEFFYKEGDAVVLTLAESTYDFDLLTGNQMRDASMFVPLIPKFSATSDEGVVPLLALQVTLFPNKGICIGLAIKHVVADGRTTTHFIKSWSSICRLESDTSLIGNSLPSHDRSTVKHVKPKRITTNLILMEKLGVTKDTFHQIINKRDAQHTVPVGKVRATFVMLSSDITKLKQWVLSKEKEVLHLSSLVVTCAYVWVCLIKARRSTDANVNDEATEYFLVPADARARLKPPLPITYFGNCLDSAVATCKRSELIGEDGIVFAAELISKAIKKMDINDETKEKGLSFYISLPREHLAAVSSSPRFAVYETDYGFGKPKKVEFVSGESISLSECPTVEGGLEIGVVRNKLEMDAFASLFANTLPALS
ncbi:malonyl-coenzyme:anthocyanin 5-O-glucoside-6'''-O-malonyltransferase-like [Thalictrum thalictroides]|uniref:Malonyl-coenzyme:anthocyanin 5-O-glucoside-6'''-O-malonyltransferase-like n=1 Tax=Thalictrum thalictroides TaxID=46969 RepID=A0A7J6V5V8_THATH|nr:malonyl-coenzyme:anthocyanin 5-O-glucoside-6'''-O-malonyltransferase-like [Thalictrum thalictroides]